MAKIVSIPVRDKVVSLQEQDAIIHNVSIPVRDKVEVMQKELAGEPGINPRTG